MQPSPFRNPTAHPETITVETASVGCDGGNGGSNGPLGHPMVYLAMNKNGQVDCPYCDRRYVLASGAKTSGH